MQHLQISTFLINPQNIIYCHQITLQNISSALKKRTVCYNFPKRNSANVSPEKALIQSQKQFLTILQMYSQLEMQKGRLKDVLLENRYKQTGQNQFHNCDSQHRSSNCMNEINVQGIEFWPFIQHSSCTELQSPINICTHVATHKHFAPLSFIDLLTVEGHAYLSNANQTATVMLKGRIPLLEGGPLRGSYKFEQLHFHWSEDDSAGSEHSLDGMLFSMECHAVHIHIRCENVSEALKYENGIAVVGNFLQVSDVENKDFLSISDNLIKIQEPESVAEISSNCFSWLRSNGHNGYYTYPGSLTTLQESKMVTWILYPDPIFVSSSQIKGFRQLLDNKSHYIKRNCRKMQNLNNREIYFAV